MTPSLPGAPSFSFAIAYAARSVSLLMKRFIEGEDRTQVALLPACLEDYVDAENPVRVVEVFVDELDLGALGFVRLARRRRAGPRITRPSC